MTMRRDILQGGAAVVAIGGGLIWRQSGGLPDASFELIRTDAEWRDALTDDQYSILRQAGTEQPFSSPLNDETRAGVFSCAGCQLENYASDTKYKSGTG